MKRTPSQHQPGAVGTVFTPKDGAHAMSKNLWIRNRRAARVRWPEQMSGQAIRALRDLTDGYRFSLGLGDLLFLDGAWYITHAGLLRLARRNGCRGIRVRPLREFCDPTSNRWVFKATVYKSRKSKGFVSYGDADLSNVSPIARGAETRVAATGAAGIYPFPVTIQSMLLPNRFFKRTRESSDGAAAPLSYRESCPCVTPSRLANSVWFSFPRKLRIRFPISLRSTKSPPRLGRPLIFLLTLCVSRILLLLIKALPRHHVCEAPSQIWGQA
jgi:hypothetical protein